MLKKLLIAFLFISVGVQSQHSITGIVSPKNDLVTRVILYQLKGAKQVYISNSKQNNPVLPPQQLLLKTGGGESSEARRERSDSTEGRSSSK